MHKMYLPRPVGSGRALQDSELDIPFHPELCEQREVGGAEGIDALVFVCCGGDDAAIEGY